MQQALQRDVAVPEVRDHAVSELSRPESQRDGEGCEDAEVSVREVGGSRGEVEVVSAPVEG